MKDLTGKRFGRLTVVGEDGRLGKDRAWKCKCRCGGTIRATKYRLVHKITDHCGCLRAERISKAKTTHGGYRTRLHNIWHGMLQRTSYPGHTKYALYGGRGITVCKAWHDFATFRAWAACHGYRDGLTLDRRNGKKGYYPGNCRWVSYKTQNLNRRFWASREGR